MIKDMISWFMAMMAMLSLIAMMYLCSTVGTWMIIGDNSSPYWNQIMITLMLISGGLALFAFRDILDRL